MGEKAKKYELVYVTHPEITDERVAALADEIKALIEKESGTVEHVEQWGKKRLAYQVKKQRYGYYTLMLFTANTENIVKFERALLYHEQVLKFITLIHDSRSALKPPAADSVSSYGSSDRERR